MEKSKPERRCVGCRQSFEKEKLLRIVRTPEGSVTIDESGKMNGRGAYLCDSTDCLNAAKKSRGLDRSFRCTVPQEVYDDLERMLKDRHG